MHLPALFHLQEVCHCYRMHKSNCAKYHYSYTDLYLPVIILLILYGFYFCCSLGLMLTLLASQLVLDGEKTIKRINQLTLDLRGLMRQWDLSYPDIKKIYWNKAKKNSFLSSQNSSCQQDWVFSLAALKNMHINKLNQLTLRYFLLRCRKICDSHDYSFSFFGVGTNGW